MALLLLTKFVVSIIQFSASSGSVYIYLVPYENINCSLILLISENLDSSKTACHLSTEMLRAGRGVCAEK